MASARPSNARKTIPAPKAKTPRTRAPRKPAPAAAPVEAAPEPTIELEDREWLDRQASAQALKAAQARHASGRRRLIDPATCERDYTDEELEFMQAMQDYKYRSGRMFPTWSEVLEVLRDLGYAKPPEPAAAGLGAAHAASA